MNVRRILLAVAATIVIAGVCVCALRPREPVYQGKRLSGWLNEMEELQSFPSIGRAQRWGRAEEAVRQMGTNAMPQLLQMLRVKDSWLKRQVMKLWSNQSIVPMPFKTATVRKRQAVLGISALGPAAKPYLPQMVELLSDRETASYAVGAMAGIGPDALAPLTAALESPHLEVRLHAALALWIVWSNAGDNAVRERAAAALQKIDPEAAASLGGLNPEAAAALRQLNSEAVVKLEEK